MTEVYKIQFLRHAIVTMLMFAWSTFAFCGEIHDAAKNGDWQKLATLIKKNPDLVFNKDNDGETPLNWAAANGHLDAVGVLLAYTSDVNSTNIDGQTPLFAAANYDQTNEVPLLLANKSKINAKDKYGATPLHWAAQQNYTDMVKLLLTNKADINAKDNNGETPLHYASGMGCKEVTKLLLADKADVNTLRITMAIRLCIKRRIRGTRTQQNCYWSTRPMSTPRLTKVIRLCISL